MTNQRQWSVKYLHFIIISSWITFIHCRHCEVVEYHPEILHNPCLEHMQHQAPESFVLEFEMNHDYGIFVAHCVRARAPIHVDRVFNLARFGYYSDNYFFRVLPNFVAQFGTAGNPLLSNIYNYTSTSNPECAILKPQPPFMPYCMGTNKNPSQSIFSRLVRSVRATEDTVKQEFIRAAQNDNGENCSKVKTLSNTFGTISMSTSYKQDLPGYPEGVTWNATAELFINLADNQRLDKHLFVPICTVEQMNTVLRFPSFGEVAELGGDGPSLGLLYEQGNAYIESNRDWNAKMAKVTRVTLCDEL